MTLNDLTILLPPCPECGKPTLTFDAATVVETMEMVPVKGGFIRDAKIAVQRQRPAVMCWSCEFAVVIDLVHTAIPIPDATIQTLTNRP